MKIEDGMVDQGLRYVRLDILGHYKTVLRCSNDHTTAHWQSHCASHVICHPGQYNMGKISQSGKNWYRHKNPHSRVLSRDGCYVRRLS